MKISVNFELEVDVREYGLTKEEIAEEITEDLKNEFEEAIKNIEIKFEVE